MKYYETFMDKFKLKEKIMFNCTVVEARWSDEEMMWRVDVQDTLTGEFSHWTANVLISATGIFNRGTSPKVPGFETFKGKMWHTVDWPKDADLKGKRVAVIGTGPSAVQVIPEIQPIVKSLTVYQRNIAHCMPREDVPYTSYAKWIWKHIPFTRYLYSLYLYLILEILAYYAFQAGTFLSKIFAQQAKAHLDTQIKDPRLRKKLRPRNLFGCTRILVSDTYYPTFLKPNVELITDPVIRITETGIISETLHEQPTQPNKTPKDSSSSNSALNPFPTRQVIDVDVIIWATGFAVQDWGSAVKITGRNGITLHQRWQDQVTCLYGIPHTRNEKLR